MQPLVVCCRRPSNATSATPVAPAPPCPRGARNPDRRAFNNRKSCPTRHDEEIVLPPHSGCRHGWGGGWLGRGRAYEEGAAGVAVRFSVLVLRFTAVSSTLAVRNAGVWGGLARYSTHRRCHAPSSREATPYFPPAKPFCWGGGGAQQHACMVVG